MATYSCAYIDVWKWLQFDWTDTWVLYGDDFNPTSQSVSSAAHCTVYQATTSFNLSWFQPWHEVWACAIEVRRDWPWSAIAHQYYWMDFERYDGSWSVAWHYMDYLPWDEITSDQYSWGWMRCYFGVDKDEVRPWYSKYRVHWYATDWTWDYYSPEFTVSNLSIDSTLHPSWYLWIDGNNICYTDNTWDEIWQNWKGYKHRIAYDSWYSTYVGTEYSWFIRIDSSDTIRYQIRYVDWNWYLRRTYSSDPRYWWNVNVGSSNAGYMWVWVSDAEDWYGYLCFVAANGSKRRILNWPPVWYQ